MYYMTIHVHVILLSEIHVHVQCQIFVLFINGSLKLLQLFVDKLRPRVTKLNHTVT